MTFGWMMRLAWAWLWLFIHGAQMHTCERAWDMDPNSPRPAGITYEEWYGSPTLLCDTGDHHHWRGYCVGPFFASCH